MTLHRNTFGAAANKERPRQNQYGDKVILLEVAHPTSISQQVIQASGPLAIAERKCEYTLGDDIELTLATIA